jgi:transcriptional regulator with XRE-family HTH domain
MPGTKPNPIDILVGHNVQFHRIAAGLAAEDLAQKIGISPRLMQDYEKGQRRIGAAGLVRIAKVLAVPVPALFAGAANPASAPRAPQFRTRS